MNLRVLRSGGGDKAEENHHHHRYEWSNSLVISYVQKYRLHWEWKGDKERVGEGDKTRDCHNYCWRVTRVLCSAQSVLSDNDNWSFSWKLEKKFIIRASEFRRERRRDVEQQFQNNEMQWEPAKTN